MCRLKHSITPVFFSVFYKIGAISSSGWYWAQIIYPSMKRERCIDKKLGGSVLCNSLFFSVTCQWFWTTGYFLRCLIFCKFLSISPAAADGSHPQQPQHAQNTYGVAAAATVQLQAVQKQSLHQLHLNFSDMSLQLLGPQEQRFLHFPRVTVNTYFWHCTGRKLLEQGADYSRCFYPLLIIFPFIGLL